ncbi:4436_t:CDS:1 [Gigaspora rosea]|nr:4436_t:CDS:1 [Gigaspora rosea]
MQKQTVIPFSHIFLYISFYECYTIKLREHVMYTKKDKWTGYKKPYISKNLNEVLLLPEELKKIEEKIEGKIENIEMKLVSELRPLKEKFKELQDSIEDLKTKNN